MTATYGCWQVSPKPLPFFLSDLFRRLSLTALVFDDCMENDTWVMWDRHRTGESKDGFDLRNPKPETRNGQLKLASIDETRNPKPETDSESAFQATKPETRNRQRKLISSDETRNPKPETRNRQRKLVSSDETRNPKPETDSESGFQWTKPETRNPKPTAKVGFYRRNPKPKNRQRKLVSIDETRNPKPETRNRLESDFWVALRIGTPVCCVIPSSISKRNPKNRLCSKRLEFRLSMLSRLASKQLLIKRNQSRVGPSIRVPCNPFQRIFMSCILATAFVHVDALTRGAAKI